jgi:hypothetical protein
MKYLTAKTLEKYYSIEASTYKEWCKGQPGFQKCLVMVGRKILINVKKLDKWLLENKYQRKKIKYRRLLPEMPEWPQDAVTNDSKGQSNNAAQGARSIKPVAGNNQNRVASIWRKR